MGVSPRIVHQPDRTSLSRVRSVDVAVDRPRITVGITTRNRHDSLQRCVASLRLHRPPAPGDSDLRRCLGGARRRARSIATAGFESCQGRSRSRQHRRAQRVDAAGVGRGRVLLDEMPPCWRCGYRTRPRHAVGDKMSRPWPSHKRMRRPGHGRRRCNRRADSPRGMSRLSSGSRTASAGVFLQPWRLSREVRLLRGRKGILPAVARSRFVCGVSPDALVSSTLRTHPAGHHNDISAT